MSVRVVLHLERLPETDKPAWWAESPDVPGFSAAALSLYELRIMAERALRDLATEAGEDPMEVRIDWHFAAAPLSEATMRPVLTPPPVHANRGTSGVEQLTERIPERI